MRSTQPTPPARSVAPFHDERIQLHLAIAIEEAAAPSIESFVIFHDHDGFFDRIHGGAAAAQRPPAGSNGTAYSVEMCLDHAVRHSPGAAVYHQHRISWQASSPREK